MSQSFEELAPCPKCGAEQTVLLHHTIDVQENPELKDALFAGQINNHQCSACGCQAPVEMDLFYHDPQKGFLAYYFPFDYFDDEDEDAVGDALAHFDDDGSLAIEINQEEEDAETPDYMKSPHLVFSMEELLRYVAFRDLLAEQIEAGSND